MIYYPIILWLTFLSVLGFLFGMDMFLKGEGSFVYRLIFRRKSIYGLALRVGPMVSTYIPKAKTMELENKLIYSDWDNKFTFESFIGFQVIFGILALIGGLILTTFGMPSFLIVIFIAPALIIPIAILNEKVKKRQEAIRKELPAMVGLLATSVKAGVELGPAFEMISSTLPGELGRELRKAMREIATGSPRSKAFKSMGRRIGVDVLDRFIETINTVEERGGMNISIMLDDFVKDVRKMRMFDIKEAINKLPLKMLLPISTCIFIPMLIILIIPVVLTLAKSF